MTRIFGATGLLLMSFTGIKDGDDSVFWWLSPIMVLLACTFLVDEAVGRVIELSKKASRQW